MVLGIDKILERVEKDNLIENLSERELKDPEGTGIDLRVGKIFRLSGEGFLGVEERDTPNLELVAEYKEDEKNSVKINPGDYFLTETIEKVNIPDDLVAVLKPRGTMHRSGVVIRVGTIDPGYSGTLHPGIFNPSNVPLTIELGARYINILFWEVSGNTSIYRGQWQGGRLTTDGKETQV